MNIKSLLIASLSLLFFCSDIPQNKNANVFSKEIKISLHNPLKVDRRDETIRINIRELKSKYPDFNFNSFVVYSNNKEVPSQAANTDAGTVPTEILFIVDLKPNESRTITIKYSQGEIKKKEYKKRTGAYLGKKADYKLENGYYTGGNFVSVHSEKVPKDHFAHDALYQFEGPGWESELVDYRFYLDSRNRTDIFGKKVHALVLPGIGKYDLVSDSKESYTKMLDWGMDIFKVGESLGIGSIAMYDKGKVETVSNADSVVCTIVNNGPIYSGVYTNYYGWEISGDKYNLNALFSITAGSRLTETDLEISGNPGNLTTGLAKHENTEFLKSNGKGDWQFIGLYGKQSLAGDNDNLGIAVFYKKSDLIKQTEDSLSDIVVLRPEHNKLKYYFADAWDQELNGIRNKKEFIKYLYEVIDELNNPIEIKLL